MMQQESKTQLGELVSAKMEEKGMSINDLKIALDVAYEHARRIVRGEGIPSRHVLYALADTLDIPRDEALRVATADKLKKKFGGIPLELAGHDPTLEPVERDWKKLTEEQQSMVIDMVKSLARRNKTSKS